MTRRRLLLAAAVLVSASLLFVACSSSRKKAEAPAEDTTTTTVALPTWPLTGLPDADAPTKGAHPAIVVKMDNSSDARPQTGLGAADIVYELLVEGITRYALVYHSDLPAPVGPVRSARSSDIDLVSDLSEPLFAWSGGNPGVTAEVATAARAGLLTDASYSNVPDAYFRSTDRIAPHNLDVRLPQLLQQAAPAGQGAPRPILTFRRPGADATGTSTIGFTVDFGSGVVVDYLWNASRGGWDRFQVDTGHDRAHSATIDRDGPQVSPANVVVMFTEYGQSPSDSRSPMALSVGSGRAIVYTGGTSVEGTWSRPDAASPAVLRDAAGAVIALTAGRTWIEMPRTGATVSTIDAAAAQVLVAARP